MSTIDSQSTHDAVKKQWDAEGYLLLRDQLAVSLIDGLRAMFERVTEQFLRELAGEGLIDDLKPELPLERRFAEAAGTHADRYGRSWRAEVASREVFDLHRAAPIVDMIGLITGTDVIGHPVFNARPKLPGQQITVVPWHQDSGYFGVESRHAVIPGCWMPLVPVDEANGCLQIVPGSHRTGLHEHHVENREGKSLELPDGVVDESRILTCPMQPGDVLIIHNLTFHRSLPNRSAITRWSLDIRYVRDGDPPGKLGWTDPSFKWIIRSRTQPATTYDQWRAQF